MLDKQFCALLSSLFDVYFVSNAKQCNLQKYEIFYELKNTNHNNYNLFTEEFRSNYAPLEINYAESRFWMIVTRVWHHFVCKIINISLLLIRIIFTSRSRDFYISSYAYTI